MCGNIRQLMNRADLNSADLTDGNLSARLGALLRRYAAAIDQGQAQAAQLLEEFRKNLRELVAEFGQPAIDAVLTELRDDASPSASLH
jgi:hypothetical protein